MTRSFRFESTVCFLRSPVQRRSIGIVQPTLDDEPKLVVTSWESQEACNRALRACEKYIPGMQSTRPPQNWWGPMPSQPKVPEGCIRVASFNILWATQNLSLKCRCVSSISLLLGDCCNTVLVGCLEINAVFGVFFEFKQCPVMSYPGSNASCFVL